MRISDTAIDIEAERFKQKDSEREGLSDRYKKARQSGTEKEIKK